MTRNHRSDGFSLIEVAVALSTLTIGILGLVAALGSTIELGDDRLVEIQKSVHVENALITIESVGFAQIASTFGAGSGNQQFWCDETGQVLFADPGNAVAVGSIQIFDDESAVPISFVDTVLGLDLNANGVIDVGPVTDYQALPIRIILSYPNNPGAPNEVGEFILTP